MSKNQKSHWHVEVKHKSFPVEPVVSSDISGAARAHDLIVVDIQETMNAHVTGQQKYSTNLSSGDTVIVYPCQKNCKTTS